MASSKPRPKSRRPSPPAGGGRRAPGAVGSKKKKTRGGSAGSSRAARKPGPEVALFRKLKSADGQAVVLILGERRQGKLRTRRQLLELAPSSGPAARRRKPPPAREAVRRARLASICAGLGHRARLEIVAALLHGAATYRELVELTGAKPGPLYHHLSQLRLAGLLQASARDRYVLTETGKKAGLTCLALGKLI